MLNTYLLNTKTTIMPLLVHRYPTPCINSNSSIHLCPNSGLCSERNRRYFQINWYILSIINCYFYLVHFLYLIEIKTNLGVIVTLTGTTPVLRLSRSSFLIFWFIDCWCPDKFNCRFKPLY